jgi:hypothetical protein
MYMLVGYIGYVDFEDDRLLHKMLPNPSAFCDRFCNQSRGVPLRILMFLLDLWLFSNAILHVSCDILMGNPLNLNRYLCISSGIQRGTP